MIPTGVGDHAASAFLVCQGCDFVVRPTQFEGADGLEVLGLEIESMPLEF